MGEVSNSQVPSLVEVTVVTPEPTTDTVPLDIETTSELGVKRPRELTTDDASLEPGTESTPATEPTPTPATEPTPTPATEPTPIPTTAHTTGLTTQRPRRTAAILCMERMQGVLEWEHCTEGSELFKRADQQINDEFDRVSRGERSYRKKPSTESGGSVVPDEPSDDELKETKDNDEAEADSVDGSSSEDGSFVVSDNHVSDAEDGDDHEVDADDKSSLTCSDHSMDGFSPVSDAADSESEAESAPDSTPGSPTDSMPGLEPVDETETAGFLEPALEGFLEPEPTLEPELALESDSILDSILNPAPVPDAQWTWGCDW